ncbi:MAG TPA: transcriptional repressor LexA [Candidatus Bathyarchaeia archaeon]|nr:transcriptional repressor LexA [Candidatus Bathyarchaeia archaeon]
MTRELTRRQGAILQFIVESIRDRGWPPTIAEIGQQFQIASTNGVNDHLVALEKKGYIERSSKARGIRVTEKAAAGLYQQGGGTLPLVGRIAAGQPLFAQENIEDFVTVAPALSRLKGYCLRVQGQSMVEAGILDGDVIVVDQEREPRAGDVVVALVGDEATVKYFHPRGNEVELQPANSAMKPLVLPAHDVEVQGVVVALQRILL